MVWKKQKLMIYSFDKNDERRQEFISLLQGEALDFEMIERDKVVIRVFGRITDDLQIRLDRLTEPRGRLSLKRGEEKREDYSKESPQMAMVIAGPCSVESEDQLDRTAAFLSERGVRYLRGGSFKPRTQSTSFQGLGRVGLEIMSRVASRYGMIAVTELMDRSQLDDVAAVADIIQVGSRNMFNYSLLTALGAVDKPVLLKRGMSATIDEWLHAADYIRKGGNERIILCERGIRTFEPRTRYTLDLLAIPIAQKLSGLPVIADVSHAAGDRSLVTPLVLASLAAGADGIMVEVHPEPNQALSDAAQSLSFADFDRMYGRARSLGFISQRSSATPYPFPR